MDRIVVSDEIAKLRLSNYEQRRRNKMRFIVEFLKNNRSSVVLNSPGSNNQTPRVIKRNAQYYEVEIQRDNQRFEHLKRVQENIEKNAIDELKHIDQIKKHIQKKELKAHKQKLQAKSEREQNKQDNNYRLQEAIKRRTAIEQESETQSMLDFEKNLIDIKTRMEKRILQERAQSAHNYSSLKRRHNTQDQQHLDLDEEEPVTVAELPKEVAQNNLAKSFGNRAASSLVPVQKQNTLLELTGGHGKSSADSINAASKSARRPQTSRPALQRKPTCQQEYETDYALERFNQRMQTAMDRLTLQTQQRSRQVTDETAKREEILQRRRELREVNEFNSLQSYVLHNRKIQKQQKKRLDLTLEIKQQLQKDLLSKTQIIESRKKQNQNDLQARFQMIQEKIVEKDYGAEQARQNMLSNSRLKREIRELQHLEVMENRQLAKQLAFVEKRQLITKQEQIKENYNDFQMLQQNLRQMRIANDQRRIELVAQRSQQVKLAKDNYLNQCELEEKKKKAKLSGEV